MANTVIALKKSGTAAAIPSSLEFGELAINYADGKIFYKAANGTVVSLATGGGSSSNSFATVNANNTLVVADSSTDILTLEPGTNISIVGDAVNDKITVGLKSDISVTTVTASGIVSGSELTSTLASGDEGGQVNLTKPPNGTLNGGVTIDAYQNKLRIFEQGGSARGVYIDLSLASAGVGTDLLASAGSTDTTARATAVAAFAKANSANYYAYLVDANTTAAFAKANSANYYAYLVDANTTASFTKANSAQTIAIAAFDKANTGGASSVNVSETGPTSPSVGNLWWNSNTGKLLIYFTDVDATSQWVEAYGSGGGTETGQIASAFTQANSAFNEANTAESIAIAAYNTANTRVTTGKAIAMAIIFGG